MSLPRKISDEIQQDGLDVLLKLAFDLGLVEPEIEQPIVSAPVPVPESESEIALPESASKSPEEVDQIIEKQREEEQAFINKIKEEKSYKIDKLYNLTPNLIILPQPDPILAVLPEVPIRSSKATNTNMPREKTTTLIPISPRPPATTSELGFLGTANQKTPVDTASSTPPSHLTNKPGC